MALKSSLRLIAKKISEAVQHSAAAEGLLPGDYVLTGTFDDRNERISLTLGTDRPVDERRIYANTFTEIRRLFPEHPQITMHIGLVFRRVQHLDETYWDSGPMEDEVDLTELLDRSSY